MKVFETFSLCVVLLTILQFTHGQQTCTTQGLQCSSDCTQVLFCPQGNGEQPVVVETCSSNKLCDQDGIVCGPAGTGTCTPGGSSTAVLCGDNGRIPDLYNCTNYYLCSKLNQPPDSVCTCSQGQEFDQEIKTCQKVTTACTSEMNSNPCTANPNKPCDVIPYGGEHYYAYICVTQDNERIPEIYNCFGLFNLINCTCSGNLQKFHHWKPETKAETCSPYVPPDGNTPPPGETEPTCTYPGQTFPAVDCHSFWLCLTDLTPRYKTCLATDHYDQQQKACVWGTCPVINQQKSHFN